MNLRKALFVAMRKKLGEEFQLLVHLLQCLGVILAQLDTLPKKFGCVCSLWGFDIQIYATCRLFAMRYEVGQIPQAHAPLSSLRVAYRLFAKGQADLLHCPVTLYGLRQKVSPSGSLGKKGAVRSSSACQCSAQSTRGPVDSLGFKRAMPVVYYLPYQFILVHVGFRRSLEASENHQPESLAANSALSWRCRKRRKQTKQVRSQPPEVKWRRGKRKSATCMKCWASLNCFTQGNEPTAPGSSAA